MAEMKRRNMETPHEIRRRWRDLLDRTDVLILDTETTGFRHDAEVVEIAVIDTTGTERYSALVRPEDAIPDEATAVHGIDGATLREAGALPWPTHYPHLQPLLQDARAIRIYNLAYDVRIIRQTSERYGLPHLLMPGARDIGCAMQEYADFRHVPHQWRAGQNRWFKLSDAYAHECGLTTQTHRALDDCRMVLDVMRSVGRER